MNDLIWLLTAVLAALLAPASGIAYQHATRNHNQQTGEATDA